MGLPALYAQIRAKRPDIFQRPMQFQAPSKPLIEERYRGKRSVAETEELARVYDRFNQCYRIAFPLNFWETSLALMHFNRRVVLRRYPFEGYTAGLLTACLLAEDLARAAGESSGHAIPFVREWLGGIPQTPPVFLNALYDDTRDFRRDFSRLPSIETFGTVWMQRNGRNKTSSHRDAVEYVELLRHQRLPEPDPPRVRIEHRGPARFFRRRQFPENNDEKYVFWRNGRVEIFDLQMHPHLPISEQPDFIAIVMDPFEADTIEKAAEIVRRQIPVMQPLGRILAGCNEYGVFRWVKGMPLNEAPLPAWERSGAVVREAHKKGIFVSDVRGTNIVVPVRGECTLIDIADHWFSDGPLREEDRMQSLQTLLQWSGEEITPEGEKQKDAFARGYGLKRVRSEWQAV